jgi:RNA polymerase sigma factor (sigma-70 family)
MAKAKATKVAEKVDSNKYDKEIAQLVERGKKENKLDQRDIFALIPDTPANIDALDKLYALLAEADTEIIPPAEPTPETLSDEWVAEDDEEVVVEDTSYIDDIADDSVRLYLREIGKIPLLTSEQELALAQRVVAGREPTNEEIATAMEMDVDKVEHIMKIKQDISSLDASVRDDEEDSVLGDFIEDEDTKTPTESASEQLLKEQVKQILSTLTEREQKILKLRFGLEDGKSHTLEEVGQEFSVTRERIRQIEAKALAKLRKHKDTRKLHEYLQ